MTVHYISILVTAEIYSWEGCSDSQPNTQLAWQMEAQAEDSIKIGCVLW